MVGAKILQALGEGSTELQHAKEFLKKQNSSIMGQTAVITGDFDVSRQAHHFRPHLTEGYGWTEEFFIKITHILSSEIALFRPHHAPDPGINRVLLANLNTTNQQPLKNSVSIQNQRNLTQSYPESSLMNPTLLPLNPFHQNETFSKIKKSGSFGTKKYQKVSSSRTLCLRPETQPHSKPTLESISYASSPPLAASMHLCGFRTLGVRFKSAPTQPTAGSEMVVFW